MMSGLKGYYFNNNTLLDPSVHVRTDPKIDFTWAGTDQPAPSVNSGVFSARWKGVLIPPVSGDYTFYTSSDNGVRLFVNNQLLIENWEAHAPVKDKSDPITLRKGRKYPILLEFYNSGGPGEIKLSWSYPGKEEEIIPTQAFIATKNYKVTVVTGDKPNAETNANVYLTLDGTLGVSAENYLQGSFPIGSTRYFDIEYPDLGNLESVHVRHDNQNDAPAWFLEKVIVKDEETGQEWVFLCGKWIGTASKEEGLPKVGCENEKQLRSINTNVATEVNFINKTNSVVKIYWINAEGQRQHFKDLNPQESFIQGTYVTHPWVVTDEKGACLGIFQPEPGRKDAIIKEWVTDSDLKLGRTLYPEPSSQPQEQGLQTGRIIALKADNGMYLARTDAATKQTLIAKVAATNFKSDPTTHFEVVKLDGNKIALKANNGQFVAYQSDQTGTVAPYRSVAATLSTASEAAQFEVIMLDGGKIAITGSKIALKSIMGSNYLARTAKAGDVYDNYVVARIAPDRYATEPKTQFELTFIK
jgi:hypothetical protein